MKAKINNTTLYKKDLFSRIVSYLSLDYSLSFIMGEHSKL